MMLTAKYVKVRLTNIKCPSVKYVTQDGTWTVSSHPSPTSQLGVGNVRYVPLATPYPRQQHDTFASPPPFSIPIPISYRLLPQKKGGKRPKKEGTKNTSRYR